MKRVLGRYFSLLLVWTMCAEGSVKSRVQKVISAHPVSCTTVGISCVVTVAGLARAVYNKKQYKRVARELQKQKKYCNQLQNWYESLNTKYKSLLWDSDFLNQGNNQKPACSPMAPADMQICGADYAQQLRDMVGQLLREYSLSPEKNHEAQQLMRQLQSLQNYFSAQSRSLVALRTHYKQFVDILQAAQSNQPKEQAGKESITPPDASQEREQNGQSRNKIRTRLRWDK